MSNAAVLKKNRKSFSIKNKFEIVKRLQRGAKQSEICSEMGLSKSTVIITTLSHLHPAARQFCRSTYTITDITIK
jgi:transposase-like protein